MSDLVGGRTDYELMARGYPFIVRRNPQPIPAAAIDAQPAACALINLEWLAHIAGAIDALNQPDAWLGSEEEIYQAQQQLEQLAAAFSTICEMSQGAQVQFRQTDCTLEVSEDNGATWTEIFNAGCAKTVITYNPDTGYIEADGEPVVSGDTIINNTIIIDDTGNLSPDGLDKRCDTASYLADLMLPSLMQEYINTKQNAANQVDIVSALIGFGVVVGGLIATVATGGATVPAFLTWIFTGLAIAETGSDLAAKVLNIDPAALTSEMTPQFWQDVKCAIYCVLPNDGILTPSVAQDIAANLNSELLTTYPNGIPLLSESFIMFSVESLGKFSIYGALYDGSNCDLCACGGWIRRIDSLPYTSKYVNLLGTTAHPPSGAFYDSAETYRASTVEVEVDLTKTPAYITGVTAFGTTYKDSNDSGGGVVKFEVWDVNAQAYALVWQAGASTVGADSFRGLNSSGVGTPYDVLTTKVRFTMIAWGLNEGLSWNNNRIGRITIYGGGPDVFQMELDEFNGV